jgi:hypothetical protein
MRAGSAVRIARMVSAPGLLAISLEALSAKAYDIPRCPVPTGAQATTLRSSPAALVQAVNQHIGDIVPPGAPFDATDVVTSERPHFRREIFVWHFGRRWVVATEHGGFAYSDPIFAYDLDDTARSATLVREQTALPETVCKTANELLSATGVGPAPR